MRAASVNQAPAVPYHTPIRGSLSTPSTIPFQGNAQYITNRPFVATFQISMRRRADQSADNGSDRRRAKRHPAGVTIVMDMVNDMMPRRRRAMRPMPPVPRRGHRRARRQNHPSHENRNCLDDLVHITPPFPDFLSLHLGREHHHQNLTNSFTPPCLPHLLSRWSRRPTRNTRSLRLARQLRYRQFSPLFARRCGPCRRGRRRGGR